MHYCYFFTPVYWGLNLGLHAARLVGFHRRLGTWSPSFGPRSGRSGLAQQSESFAQLRGFRERSEYQIIIESYTCHHIPPLAYNYDYPAPRRLLTGFFQGPSNLMKPADPGTNRWYNAIMR